MEHFAPAAAAHTATELLIRDQLQLLDAALEAEATRLLGHGAHSLTPTSNTHQGASMDETWLAQSVESLAQHAASVADQLRRESTKQPSGDCQEQYWQVPVPLVQESVVATTLPATVVALNADSLGSSCKHLFNIHLRREGKQRHHLQELHESTQRQLAMDQQRREMATLRQQCWEHRNGGHPLQSDGFYRNYEEDTPDRNSIRDSLEVLQQKQKELEKRQRHDAAAKNTKNSADFPRSPCTEHVYETRAGVSRAACY